MCGIAGLVDLGREPVDPDLIRRMTAILAHRGPDGGGFYVDGPVALGHRRLAIIDLATGAQPMGTADGKLWITFNGEIYNFHELRMELEALGYGFRTTSDTEVILAAYDAWGAACLRRLRGMFAFGVWDGRRRRLFLARDRVGIKPLVYAFDGHRLWFASELKAILEDSRVPRELDWRALRDYFTYLYVPAPSTIFRAIRKLAPASYLMFELDRGVPSVHRYWELTFAPDESRPEAEWIEGLRWHLDDAVRCHLVSDVPIGAFLSGGMDSSTVVAAMARMGSGPVRTFSIGFDETDFDELRFARRVAQRYGTDHYEFVVKADACDVLPRLAWQFDEPFADASALPTYYVSKITREHVTVALSGDGGDENFAGYRRYARARELHRKLDRFPGIVARLLLRKSARLLRGGARGRGYAELLGADPVERYFRMVTYQTTSSLRRLLTAAARAQMGTGVDSTAFEELARSASTGDYVALLQCLDVQTYLPDDILTKVDRTSMLTSLESRVPLLDHVLMEFVFTMPTRLKLRNGEGKAILKRVMADSLPAEVLERPKMGFGVPLRTWFRRGLADYARDVLLSRTAAERGIVDRSAAERLLDEHQAGRDRSSVIWSLLCFEQWARQWLDR